MESVLKDLIGIRNKEGLSAPPFEARQENHIY